MNDLEILYEDNDIIAVNKQEGLASIHDSAGEKEDLQSILSERCKLKVFVVHRLDKEVSGVIVYAKNAETHKLLNKQFAERTVKKSYVALVHGKMMKDEGSINKPIREFGSGRMGIDEAKGKPSKTVYKVIKKYPSYTLIELNPTTGRRHQLRVHLYYVGNSIVGDVRYGEKAVQERYPRLMLHAKELVVNINGSEKTFSADIPQSFSKYLQVIDE